MACGWSRARSTLRRAAIVFAGRIPTEEEYGAIKVAGLGKQLSAGDKGPDAGFAGSTTSSSAASNDRLLTDRDESRTIVRKNGMPRLRFVDYANDEYSYYDKAAEESGDYDCCTGGPIRWQWYRRVQYGVSARAAWN